MGEGEGGQREAGTQQPSQRSPPLLATNALRNRSILIIIRALLNDDYRSIRKS